MCRIYPRVLCAPASSCPFPPKRHWQNIASEFSVSMQYSLASEQPCGSAANTARPRETTRDGPFSPADRPPLNVGMLEPARLYLHLGWSMAEPAPTPVSEIFCPF